MVRQIIIVASVTASVFLSSCIEKQNLSVNSRTSSNVKSNSGMFLALDPSSDNSPIVWISVDDVKITSVALCKGAISKCKESLTQDLSFQLPPEGKRNDRLFFKSDKPLTVTEENLSILGLDSNKKLVDIKGIKFTLEGSTSTTTTSPLNLSSGQDFGLKQNDGTQIKLSSLFTSQYFILDFASSGCGGCVSRAKEHNNDEEFKKMLNSQKCQFGAIVPDGELKDWNSSIGGETSFIAKRSYSVSMGEVDIAKLFGLTLDGLPTIILIDRNGKMLDKADGEISEKVKQLCGESSSSSAQNNSDLTDDSSNIDDSSINDSLIPNTGSNDDMIPGETMPGSNCGSIGGG